jgi:hypothetical protein
MSARERILERFSSLSPKLQAAARYVVDHPNEVVIQSMRNLAEVAGTKPATLVRLAQQIGFAGWLELKSAFTEDLGLHAQRYGRRAGSLAARGQDAGFVSEMFLVQRCNLAPPRRSFAIFCRGYERAREPPFVANRTMLEKPRLARVAQRPSRTIPWTRTSF